MYRPLRAVVPALLLFTVAACTDAPLGITDDTLSAPPPEFLIGNSPLITLDKTKPAVEVTVEVTRGLTQVRIEDKFKIRTTVEFTGFDNSTLVPLDISLVGVKDDGVRQGGTVAVTGCIDIPAPLWDALVAAGLVEAKATVELVMTDGAGKEHVLDTEGSTFVLNAGDPS